MSSKERLRFEVLMIAVKETIEAVVEKTEKGTVLNRIRTQNRSIAALSITATLSYQAVRELADFEVVLSCP